MKSGRKRKIMVCIFLVVGVIVLGNVSTCFTDHSQEVSPEEQMLKNSIEDIREYVLNDTPIGMNMEEVLKVIEKHDEWELGYISYDHGHYESGIGEKSIHACIGQYKEKRAFGIGATAVVVWWAFDEDANLIDVFVRKDTDAL